MLEVLGFLTLVGLAVSTAALFSAIRSRLAARGDELRFDPCDVAELELRFAAVIRERASGT